MTSPYFPEHLGEEELHVPELRLGAEAYEQLRECAQRLHIEPPSEVMTYALSLFVELTTELEKGTRLLIHRPGETVTELSLPHPTRPGEPLVAQPDFMPPPIRELAGRRGAAG